MVINKKGTIARALKKEPIQTFPKGRLKNKLF